MKKVLRRMSHLGLVALLASLLVPDLAWGHFQEDIAHIWAHVRELADKRYVQTQDESYLKRDPAPYCAAMGATPESYAPCAAVGTSVVSLEKSAYVGGISIAIGREGNPVMSYLNAGALRVLKCNDRNCTGGNERISTVQTLASKGASPTRVDGETTSLAIGTDGLPVIAYATQYTNGLRVAKCNDTACTGGDESIRTIDATDIPRVVTDTSLAIGHDGYPIISYVAGDRLKVAKCDDRACAGSGELIRLVAPDDDGTGTSIAIFDTIPVIVHSRDGQIMYIRCGDPTCDYTGFFGFVDRGVAVTSTEHLFNYFHTAPTVVIGWDEKPLITVNRKSTIGGASFQTIVVRCTDDACEAHDESTVGSNDGSQSGASPVAISHRGLPVIARQFEGLSVANCIDVRCAVDGAPEARIGRAGHAPAIAMGTDGRAVIAYVGGGLALARVPS